MSQIESAISRLDNVLEGLEQAIVAKKENINAMQQDLFVPPEQDNAQPSEDGLSKEKTQALAQTLDRMIMNIETLLETNDNNDTAEKEVANG